MTLDDYHNMFKAQGESCAICNKKDCKFNIDHCHKTGRVRGIICSRCNNGLYMFEDFHGRVLDYLDENETP